MIMTRTQAPSTLGCIMQQGRMLPKGQAGLGDVLRMWHSIAHSGRLPMIALKGRNGYSAAAAQAAYGYTALSNIDLRNDESRIVDNGTDVARAGLNTAGFAGFLGLDVDPSGNGNRRCWSHRWRNRVT